MDLVRLAPHQASEPHVGREGEKTMGSFGWSLFYFGIVVCLLSMLRILARIEDHVAAIRRRNEEEHETPPEA